MARQWTLEWSGRHISLNQWYSSKHWAVRQKQKTDWHKFYEDLLHKAGVVPIPAYRIKLVYNSRLDPCNTITMVKLLEDTMTELGLIPNDTKKYCRGIELEPDLEMKSGEYRVTIYEAH